MNKKSIRWSRWEYEKEVLICLKYKVIFKKVSYFLLVFCLFWPVRYMEVIFTGIIQTGLELSVR